MIANLKTKKVFFVNLFRCFSSSPVAASKVASPPPVEPSTTKTTLWRWGSTAQHSFWGKTATNLSKLPQKIPGYSEVLVKAISAGRNHSAFIVDGDLYTYGSNEYGQLGRTVETSSSPAEPDHTPRKVEFNGNPRIKTVACGSYHTAAITEDGLLYTFGWGGSLFSGVGALGTGARISVSSPLLVRKFYDLQEPIEQVVCGQQHTLALTKSGKIFSCGKGEFGRLGRGKGGDQAFFEEIEYFKLLQKDMKIRKISCGTSHSAALSEKGDIWVWGRNDYGQLGLEDSMGDLYSNEIYPRVIQCLQVENVQVDKMSSGEHHMLALARNGKVYFWGGRAWLTPKLVALDNLPHKKDSTMKIAKVEGGGDAYFYSMAIADSGELFSWGKPTSSCLARSVQHDANEPRLVDPSLFEEEKVVDIACGHYRVLALTHK